ncbi:MAG: NADH-quinone oxidoreductase subunit N [bacterium]
MSLDWIVILMPLWVISIAVLVIMLQIAFYRRLELTWGLSALALVLTMASLIPASAEAGRQVTPLLMIDHWAICLWTFFLFAALILVVVSGAYWRERAGERDEFYLLLLAATLGSMVVVSATHVASVLLGLELLGVSLYALIAYPERGDLPLEASIKYLVLSGAASAILLFGFALVYAGTGELGFAELGDVVASTDQEFDKLLTGGFALIIAGLAFKLSLVPFHIWTPDVYQGAPMPTTGFLGTVSKCAVFVLLIRFVTEAQLWQFDSLSLVFSAFAVLSMLAGNWLALQQNNLKRLLGYSSIAHMGYVMILVALIGQTANADLTGNTAIVEGATYYILAYLITSLAAFVALGIASSDAAAEAQTVKDVSGLFWSRPTLALALTVAFLSLAGIPLTAGFLAKFYIFTLGAGAGAWLLLGVLIVGSAIGIYYYLRVIYAMALRPDKPQAAGIENRASANASERLISAGEGALLALVFIIILFGVAPQKLMEYFQALAVSVAG